VAIFNRRRTGVDTAGSVSTGGLGSGAGLGSQGALVLSKNGKWLFAVNAGSNEISCCGVAGGLSSVDKIASGGAPHQRHHYKDLVYVLNDGGSGNITGFRLTNRASSRRLQIRRAR
jgi:hypothetical protein